MKTLSESFVVVYLKGGKTVRLNNESQISQGLFDEYSNATRAELYSNENNEKRLLDTIYNR
jgi:hypothetical protein